MKPGGRFNNGRFAASSRTAVQQDPWARYTAGGADPDIVADFARDAYRDAQNTTGLFGDMFNLTRSGIGTYTDASGTLRVAAADTPRFDYVRQGGAWLGQGLLVESEARTNLFHHSAGFDNSAWTKSRANITTNDGLAPDGTNGAQRLTSTASTFDGAVRQSVSYNAGDVLSFSVYARAGDRPFLFLRERARGFPKDSYFDLSAGVMASVNSAHTAQMLDMGNGWYRCSITVEASQTATTGFEIYNSQENLNTASAQPGYTYIWGAQLEVGRAPSSYIPTQATPATRAAETLTLQAARMFDLSLSGAASLMLAGRGAFSDDAGLINLLRWGSDPASRIEHIVTSGQLQVTQTTGGSAETIISASSLIDTGHNVPFRLASRHDSTGLAAAVQGQSFGPATIAGLSGIGQTSIDMGIALMGHLSELRIWSSALDIPALQDLTA